MADAGPIAADTIFAPATAPGRAAVALIRLSGPACANVCRRLTGKEPPAARQAALRSIRDPQSGETLDRGLVIWFPGPHSLTGEDVLELQVHGGRAVITGVLEALSRLSGLRAAEPGEFSRRAFLNDRLDLTAAEGLADLVEAETRAQARQALRQLGGGLGDLYMRWRETLLRALAHLEAEIDFAPDEEVPDDLLTGVRPEIARLSAEIAAHLADDHRGERLRAGLTVAVVGPPNAGKSSLVNLIARRDVAIVTATPGTTRDVLEVPLEVAGYPITMLDTAGLREVAADEVEAEGVRRARDRAEAADLRLVLFDGADWPRLDRDTVDVIDDDAIIAISKADLGRLPPDPRIAGRRALGISCVTGRGVDELLDALSGAAARLCSPGDAPLISRSRHRSALRETLDALDRFCTTSGGSELALMAEDLRLASRALGRITGQVVVDDLLDRIFNEFCIGK